MGASFTVDTHVFRELGELLVGRDSTALIELIKNSYDADATEVTIYGHALTNKKLAYIQISDNGTGMTEAAFSEGFLRIASRTKEQWDRRSIRYKRRFTGAKGSEGWPRINSQNCLPSTPFLEKRLARQLV